MLELVPEYHIGIIGCGKMGKDLFDWLTGFPFAVTWVCRTEEQAEKMTEVFNKKQNRIRKYGLEEKSIISFRQKHTLIASRPEELAGCDFVIETITEDIDLKKEIYKKLEKILPEGGVLASNTSSIPPEKLFDGLANERNALGLHFFFPVAMKNMVEINIGRNTGRNTVAVTEKFLKRSGKFYLKLTGNDHFTLNRMFLKMQAGCCRLVWEEKAKIEEIDALVKKHLFPVGIFEFFDFVGLDVMLSSVRNYVLYETDSVFFEPMLKMLEQNVEKGRAGKKAKAGFYDYSVKSIFGESLTLNGKEEVLQQIIRWYLDGVYDVLNRKVSSPEMLEQAIKEYMGTDKSPFELACETGYENR